MKIVFKAIIRLTVKAVAGGAKTLKRVGSTIYGSALLLSCLTLIIMALGLGVIIADGKVSFTQNKDNLVPLGLGPNGAIDPNAADYVYQVAQALDLDKINSDYKKNSQMKNFFNDLRIYPIDSSNSIEFPGKDIDIYMLCCEIEARPEINSTAYDSKVMMEFILGNWRCESSCAMGTGERLWQSEVAFFCNSSGYCDPLGQHHALYTGTDMLSNTGSVGCSFISQFEKADIPDEQRGIFNSNYASISASDISARTMYPTDTAPFRNSPNIHTASSSDKAIQYLLGHKIKGAEVAHRGSYTWLPDAFYTAFYANRVMNEGRDRDTHNSTSGITGNNEAIKKLCNDAGLTDDQRSMVLGTFAASNRFFKWDTQNVKEGPASDGANTDGLLIYTYMIMFGENSLQDYAAKHHSVDWSSNIAIRNDMFGDPNFGAQAIYPDSLYAGLKTKVNSGSGLLRTYNANTKQGFIDFADFWANSEGCSPFGQKSHNLQYPGLSFIYGATIKADLEALILAYYDYTDASGNHPYRLFDVAASSGELGDGVNVGGGQGPFGITYTNPDGTVNYKNIVMASYIFGQLVYEDVRSDPTITVKGTYTMDLPDGSGKYTVKLHDGKDVTYPNFWGSKYNETAVGNWGQCTWWAKGRTMLAIYENVSKEPQYWDVNEELTGNGDSQVFNFTDKRHISNYSSNNSGLKTNSVCSCPTWDGTNHVFFVEYADPKSGLVFESHGNIGCKVWDDTTAWIQQANGTSVPMYGTSIWGNKGKRGDPFTGSGYSFIVAFDPKLSTCLYSVARGVCITDNLPKRSMDLWVPE